MISKYCFVNNPQSVETKYNKWILALSIVIPLVVAMLFSVKLKDFGLDVKPLSFLPPIYASINALTAIVLITAVMAVRRGYRKTHEYLMKLAIGLSALFLLMYVAYHMTAESTPFGGTGPIRYVYFVILLSHIFLSVAIIPLVLISFVRALAGRFDRHKKISRIAYPLWLYVAISGVLVYLMIAPYYAH